MLEQRKRLNTENNFLVTGLKTKTLTTIRCRLRDQRNKNKKKKMTPEVLSIVVRIWDSVNLLKKHATWTLIFGLVCTCARDTLSRVSVAQRPRAGALGFRHVDKVASSCSLQRLLCHSCRLAVAHTEQLLLFNYGSIKQMSFSNGDIKHGYWWLVCRCVSGYVMCICPAA